MNTHRAHRFHRSTRAVPQLGSRRRALLALAAILLSALAMTTFQAKASPAAHAKGFAAGYVYTANKHANSISEIDLSSGRVTTIPTTISPHNVHLIQGGRLLLVVGDRATQGHGGAAHEASEIKGRLLVFETTGARLTGPGAIAISKEPVADIPVGAQPTDVVSDPLGGLAFVTNAGADTISVVDLVEQKVIETIGIGRHPYALRMDPDARELYVTNVEDGTVSVIDIGSLTEVTRIPVGKSPVQITYNMDGDRVYVSLRDEDRVVVVDTEARAAMGTIDVGRNPIQTYATPDGRFVYTVNQGSAVEPADTVSVIDITTGHVIDTIRTGVGAHGISMSRDGAYVFVTNTADHTVSVIDASTRMVITAFDVGQGPTGIVYRPF